MSTHSSLRAGRGSIVWAWTVFALAITSTGRNDIQKQQSLAIKASERFERLYNGGSCEQIYDESSAYFHRHETHARWLKDCSEMRKRFGSLFEFTPASNNSWPIGEVGI